MRSLKPFAAVCIAAGLALGLAGCGDKDEAPKSAAPAKTLTIGVSPVPGGDMMNFLKPRFAEKGIELKVVEFGDYIQPNMALSDGSLDANFFQHKPYLDDFIKQHNLKLESLVPVFIAPIAVYSRTLKDPTAIADGSAVSIPNDPTNGGRALLLLQHLGLIKLNDPKNLFVTPADIVENPKHLKIIEVEAAQLPRSLDDVAMAVINCNFALGANLNPVKDSIAIEAKDSPYANVVAVRQGEADRPEFQVLKTLITSPEMKKFIEDKYQGSFVPTF
ncbi:MAG: MetQ/NlpA family ABC transporter substrate-binding protein [Sutterella sp.]|nr:MetQ/NlpA family ABC transporter substrate-binding protein [Sutterella sp.]MDO5532359.1 MetQ/NlpA family ABC transporter substrate-binding protein [Sutterella sp.]